ncbi:MAG: RNA polymerase subunit sigma-24 [Oscillospiraceae bacterium]|nr:RNA polymerase subunit sigma-24 [Oscillospiraceae bacterium]
MKNYKDSDYALNKYSGGIVYRFADGIVEVTLADYLAENPGKTENDFRALKELSNNIYLMQAQDENAQTKKNTCFDELDETSLCCEPSPEDLFIDELNAQEESERYERNLKTARFLLDKLTEVQRRRYLMYHVDGLSTWEIAKAEGVNQKSIHECLEAADKKIKKVLASG